MFHYTLMCNTSRNPIRIHCDKFLLDLINGNICGGLLDLFRRCVLTVCTYCCYWELRKKVFCGVVWPILRGGNACQLVRQCPVNRCIGVKRVVARTLRGIHLVGSAPALAADAPAATHQHRSSLYYRTPGAHTATFVSHQWLWYILINLSSLYWKISLKTHI